MSNTSDNIFRDGTSQKDRYPFSLDPKNISIDGRDKKYFLQYVAKLSEKISYYDNTNSRFGSWAPFFPSVTELEKFLRDENLATDHPPQLALFLAFIRLMEIVKTDVNALSGEHLKFYYKQVLRFRPQKSLPEKANVVFEVSPNAQGPVLLQEGLELLGGKDAKGNLLIFITDNEVTVSRVSISRLSTILVDRRDMSRVFAAPKANSSDGIGAPLPQAFPYWSPFGETQVGKQGAARTMVDGKVGFAIASPILLLTEGERSITITLKCLTYRITPALLESLRDLGVHVIVVQMLESLSGIIYEDLPDLQQATFDTIGETNFNSHWADILDHVSHPFRHFRHEDLEHAFLAEGSGEKGWFRINQVVTTKQLESELRVQLRLEDTDPSIVELDPAIHLESINSTHPVVRLTLDHSNPVFLYDEFRGIKFTECKITVEVNGIRKLILLNDNGPLNSDQAFFPFGPVPAVDSVFYFGNREVFSKKLDKLELELSWANLPDDSQGFADYYTEYPAIKYNETVTKKLTNDDFTADFSVLHRKKWVSTETPSATIRLFKTKTADVPGGDHPLLKEVFRIELPVPSLEADIVPEFSGFDPALSKGFGRLVLNKPDFQHTVFPRIFAEKVILKATTAPNQDLPNPPYTPKINHCALNYSSTVSIHASDALASHSIFHVEPLGMAPMDEAKVGELFPQFPQGSLYIGLVNVNPPLNVSILFQMVEGTADPDVEVNRNDVSWSYLDGTSWKTFDPQSIPIDYTHGLQVSGIITFSIPSDASDRVSFWPKGLHWIRASFGKDPAGASKIAGILTNAMVVTLKHSESSPFLTEPLQPESITKLLVSNPLIKSVKQPFGSFSGRAREEESFFYQRVSERLRHKKRAVNLWDYEHLVLEAFPSIYKVKCLANTDRSMEPAPGCLTLLVIPDLRKRNKINPFEPKVNPVLRSQINEFLTSLRFGFAKVFVDNPQYEEIFVEMSVGLKAGFDGSIYGNLLNEELKRFLSPWAFEEGEDIVFGGSIFRSSILSFVEHREYVDYVTNFKLYHVRGGLALGDMRIRDDAFESDQDFIVRADTVGEEVTFEVVASSAKSIMVTAQNHSITVLNPGEFVCTASSGGIGIGEMIIEVDFFVF